MEQQMSRLVVATGNAKKLKELRAILESDAFGVGAPELVTTVALGLPSPDETGDTFEANALLKARFAFDATGLPTLADDSGLEVDALDGAPGVFSARFAGPDADDAANNARLMQLLSDVPESKRTARFRCCIAVVFPAAMVDMIPGAATDGVAAWFVCSGAVEGRIVNAASGQGGFGYDPYFFHPPSNSTFAELPLEAKQSVSHRGRALAEAAPKLRVLFG